MHGQRQAVDEQHDVRPAAVLALDDGELVDREPVVLLGPLEVDHPRLVAGDRAVRPAVLDRDAVDEHPVQRAVALDQGRRLDPQQLAVGVVHRRRRQIRIQPRERSRSRRSRITSR